MLEIFSYEKALFTPNLAIIYTFALPLVAAFIAAVSKRPNIREGCIITVAVMLFINVVNLFLIAKGSGLPEIELIEVMPGLSLTFNIDPLGILFALVASFLWVVTSIYSIGYMRGNNEANQGRFYVFFALAIFGVMGIAFAGNMFTLFIFYEFLTLSTFPLVGHHGNEASKKAGRTYLGILLGTSIGLQLIAIIWTYSIAGTLDFREGGILEGKIGGAATGLLLLLYVYGIGKAALMPIHRWLPAAMVAPTPVSALLHAVAVVKAGVFTMVKVIVYIFGTENLSNLIDENWWAGGWLVYLAGISIITASIIALRQDNLKKRLAYSTISQLSYITMAVAILAPQAIMAAGFHIAAHAVSKITLFFAAGSIYTASGKKNVSQLDGIGRRMPWTMGAFTIAALSMIGIPPAVGFLTKYYMMLGAFSTGQYFVIAVLLLSTLLNAAYFLPIIYAAFFKEEKPSNDTHPKANHGEAPLAIVIAITVTAILTIGLFLFPDLFLHLSAR